jgi:tetratricopeptide (TPR) repeat protein
VGRLKTNILADPVLVEREQQIEQLQFFLNSAKEGKGTAVFVSGEAGAGKTRLIAEFLDQAKKQSVTVLSGWCLSNAAVPYFPFFEAFNNYFSNEKEPKEVELKNWLLGPPSEKFGRSQIVTPQVWKDQTFTAVANTLASISDKQPVILFIDDLHWADSASLALLHYLGQTIGSEKVLLLATFRSEQLTADSEGRPNPLVETLRLMKRQDLVEEISVSSLDQTGVGELAKNMLGGFVKEALVQKLSAESQGNPLFVVESLRMLYERNELTLDSDKWELVSGAIGIPPKIKDIILQRLGQLVRSQRDVLDMASVLGEKFDPSLLASVLNQDPVEVIRTLDLIGKETSLVRCEGELYRFDHARTRDAIYGDISSALRRVYHGKVATQLEDTILNGKLPFSDLAYQYAQAGNKEKSVKFALAAGQDALAKWSNSDAVRHFSYVLQTIGESAETAQVKQSALENLGDAYFANNNLQQATDTFEQLADLRSGADRLRAIRKALHASIYLADIAKYQSLIVKAQKLATTDRLEAARLLQLMSFDIQAPQDWITACVRGEGALKVFEEEYELSETAQVLQWLGYGHAIRGELERGVECALRSIVLYEELRDYRSLMEAYAYAGGTIQACTFADIAFQMFAKADDVNERYKIWDYVRLFPAYVWESMGLVAVDIPSAVSKALKALEYFKKTDSYLYAGPVHGVLIVAHALAGDTAHVEEYYQKLMSLPEYILKNAPTQVFIAPTLGVYFAAKGDFEKSNQTFSDWLALLKTVFPNPFLEASSRQLYSWALSQQGKTREAQVQTEEAQKIVFTTQQRFSHVNVVPNIITVTRPEANQPFPMRIDLVNVSSVASKIIKIYNFPAELEILKVSSNCAFQDGQVTFKDQGIKRFEVKTVNLKVKASASKPEFPLTLQVTFVNEAGEAKNISHRQMNITVQSQLARPVSEDESEIDILKKFGLSK